MLLRHKKTQGEEQNWSLVLNPIPSEIDKRRIARKISETFSLSEDEASDLVANTPIILLDNLTRPVAIKAKKYFQSLGAQIMLTNDVFLKRKCYRTIWPDPPNLSFLEGESSPPAPSTHRILDSEEAIHAMQSEMTEDESPSEMETLEPVSLSSLSPEREEPLAREIEYWKHECIMKEDEARKLRQELERTQNQILSSSNSHSNTEELIRKQEKEIQELQTLLSNAEEKYEGLKEEYRDARVLLEDKVNSAQNEASHIRSQIAESFKKIENLENQLRQHADCEQKILRSADELHRKDLKIDEVEQNLLIVEKDRQMLERSLTEQTHEINLWRDKYQVLAPQQQRLEATVQEEKNSRFKVEERLRDLEKNQLRLIQEMETKNREARQWELRALELDKTVGALRQAQEEQTKFIETNQRNHEARDRELEAARRQLREINYQIEQREASQKRMQLVNQLAGKETRLKELVKMQEKIESRIRDCEEEMKRVLGEQEGIEKDIIEAKQAERHLMEQAKKERPLRARSGRPENGNPPSSYQHDEPGGVRIDD